MFHLDITTRPSFGLRPPVDAVAPSPLCGEGDCVLGLVESKLGQEFRFWTSGSHNTGLTDKQGIPHQVEFGMFTATLLVWDSTERWSAAVYNTDFRLGLYGKANWHPSTTTAMTTRIRFGHESSHIGDEIALYAQEYETDFFRVNVTYLFLDATAGMEWMKRGDELHVTARVGAITQVNPDKGFYGLGVPYGDSMLETGYETSDTAHCRDEFPECTLLVPSKRRVEPYVQGEVRWKTPMPGVGLVVSAELRNRIVYGYQRGEEGQEGREDIPEETQPSLNVVAGIWSTNEEYNATYSRQVYLRFYDGSNYNGQFRNQNSYRILGLGLRIPIGMAPAAP